MRQTGLSNIGVVQSISPDISGTAYRLTGLASDVYGAKRQMADYAATWNRE